jgi:phosphatidate cytidylyltransferase
MNMASSAVWKRLASAVIVIPVFVWAVLWAPAALFFGLVIALAGAAAWELSRMFERAGHRTWSALGVVTTMTTVASFLVPDRGSMIGPMIGPMIGLTLATVAVLSAPLVTRTALSVQPAATALLSVVYIGWLLGHAILLRRLPGGAGLVLFVVGVTWAGESAAYAAGNAFGRHRLAPRVSPGKTVEGAAAQAVVSVIAALVLHGWLVSHWSILEVAGAGLLLGVIGQVGDLAESVIKRSLNTKDTGGLIPGHGGVLDRLDSLLFNVPALVYYVTLAEGLS